MDVRLTSEQEVLRDSAARLVGQLGPRTTAELDDEERSAKLDAALQATGWRDLRSVSEAGGPWSTAVEASLVAEELGRGLADTPFVGPTLAAELSRLLGRSAKGRETVALTANLRDLGQAVAEDAAGAVVALAAGDQVSSVGRQVVERSLGAGVEGVDLTRMSRLPGGQVAAVGIIGRKEMTRWTALGLALTSADLCGVMRGALDLASRYAAERRQYGASIGSFQAVRHLLADALVATEGSRSIALHAAWGVDALPANEALAAAAAAKAYCARAARDTCEIVIQVHGGIGNTWDCLAHVFLRRALASTEQFGGVAPNLRRVLSHRGIEADDELR
jgi:alkylation response protein AidB-like acyl-CoA dehydrogenase